MRKSGRQAAALQIESDQQQYASEFDLEPTGEDWEEDNSWHQIAVEVEAIYSIAFHPGDTTN